MNKEVLIQKPVKDRDNLDLLNLICELSGRSALHRTKVLHDAFWEARKELESRLLSIEQNVKASVATKVDSSTSDGKQNNSSNSGEQQPVTGDAIEALKLCQPYMEDLQFENHNEPAAGISYDYKLDKAIRALYKCLGIETHAPQPPTPEPGNVEDTDVIVDRLLDKITPEMQERIDKEMAEEKKKWEPGNVVTGELYWKQRCDDLLKICEMAHVPQILRDYPHVLAGKPTNKDIEWAKEKIAEIKNQEVEPGQP